MHVYSLSVGEKEKEIPLVGPAVIRSGIVKWYTLIIGVVKAAREKP